MNFEETLEWLYAQLPMYQRVGKTAYKKDLTNTLRLLDLLGNPHHDLKFVHVAGTNGKGTTCHMVASILAAAGYRVGLYTSPHLQRFTERIRIGQEEIGEQDVVRFVSLIKDKVVEIQPSFFEMTVAMAFWYFREQQVDLAVVETGLGGRLDSTNVIQPLVSVITQIGYDHMDILGDTLPKIASEKAGIAKEGVPLVLSAAQPEIRDVFVSKAKASNCKLIEAYSRFEILVTSASLIKQKFSVIRDGALWLEDLVINNGGAYVLNNLPGVLASLDALSSAGFDVGDNALRKGLAHFVIKGRVQVLSERPLVIADISHNAMGIAALMHQVRMARKGQLRLVLGFVRDKQVADLLDLFPKDAIYYFTQSHVPRALPVVDLEQLAMGKGLVGQSHADVNKALALAQSEASSEDLIVVTGSTFVVAEIEDL